jgi:hypothetical protein
VLDVSFINYSNGGNTPIATASGSVGYLDINLNGTQYKLALYN